MNDTIAAISSGLTASGIGIIRVSGPESREIVGKIFASKSGKRIELSEANHIYYGFITNVSRETSDEVLVMNMPAPHSFTGEDTVEIDCHGGTLMMKRVLEAVLDCGARIAEPGEFTKRAFLNGRMDLSQAEAVIDIINAKNDNAIKASVSQLKGSVSVCIRELRAEILNKTAFIESALDDPEHYSLDGFAEVLRVSAEELSMKMKKLIESFNRGKIISEGINTVIIGKPNAGKSSLLNAMLGEERAIVTQIPGTTRDTINESISIGGITLNLMDTAGIRDTEDVVENIGVQRALKCADQADLILCVIDMSAPLDESDETVLNYLSHSGCKTLLLLNKSDLDSVNDIRAILDRLPSDKQNYLSISAKNQTGIEELFDRIEQLFSENEISYNDQLTISSLRHKQLLQRAKSSIDSLMETIDNGMPEDFYTVDLMDAYSALGEIIGEEVNDDLINEIFSKFCMGK